MRFRTHASVLAILGSAAVAHGGIIGTTGAVSVIPAPSDVSNGARESDTQIIAFNEQQNVALPSGVTVDVSVPSAVPTSATDFNLSTAVIPAGAHVSSYFLHFDAVGSPLPPVHLTGSITFDSDILGIAIMNNALNASAPVLGLPGLAYSTNGELDLNSNVTPAYDSLVLSGDRRTISVDLRDATAPDDLRVITSAVPEPATGCLLAWAGMAATLRRRR